LQRAGSLERWHRTGYGHRVPFSVPPRAQARHSHTLRPHGLK
jgi:hypothetical protein